MGFFSQIFSKSNNSELLNAIKEGALLVDVRSPDEFLSGTVNSAINIPVNMIPNRLHQLKGKKHIIVFCRSGSRSALAKNILAQNGILNVVDGGTWQNVAKAVAGK